MMDANETDSLPRNDSHRQHEQSDTVEWSQGTPYCGRTPPGHDDGWTISTISRRFAHGACAESVGESPMGESVILGDAHWYVTIKRDQFPQSKRPTAEYDHYVVPDTNALAAWFGDEAEIL